MKFTCIIIKAAVLLNGIFDTEKQKKKKSQNADRHQ